MSQFELKAYLDAVFALVYRAKNECLLVNGKTEDDEACLATVDHFLNAAELKIHEIKRAVLR